MSRIGKKVIVIADKVTVNFDAKTRKISVKGPLGELTREIHPCVSLDFAGQELTLMVKKPEDKLQRSIWGTSRAVIANMIDGVTKGFEKQLELNGVGYKMELQGSNSLTLHIGFSHPVKIEVPTGIKLTLNKNLLTGTGYNKEEIGNFFANIFKMKPCDVYKQKGFKVPGKFYRKKVVKKSK